MKQKSSNIFQNRRVNHSDKPNESKSIVLPTDSIINTIEKNLCKFHIKFVTTTSKTIRLNATQHKLKLKEEFTKKLNQLKLEREIYTITCNNSRKEFK